MRYLTIFAGIALLFCTSALSAQPNNASFAGKWVINAAKCDGNEAAIKKLQIDPGTLKIDQSPNKMVIEGFRIDPVDGSSTMEKMAFRLDGQQSRNDNDSVFNVSHATWSDNGNKLTISTKTSTIHNDRKYSFNTVEVYSLEHGNLVVDVTYDNPYTERKYTAVYDRATR